VDVYAADRLEANLETLKPELELQAQTVNAALRSGRASSVDALTAQAAILELDDRLIEARREQRAARVALARWIGDEARAAALSVAPDFASLPVAPGTLLATLHQHASVLAYEAQMALARTEIDMARAEKRADWSAELSYAKRGDAFSDMVSLEFRVGLPLFSRNRQDPVISAKRAELRRLESQRETELRMHSEEVASTLASWQSAHDRVELLQRERSPLARQRTQAALAGYRAGGTALTDVLGGIVAEVELQQTYSELIRELGHAWVFLRYLQPQEGSP
jgi:outer membrane protein TolC